MSDSDLIKRAMEDFARCEDAESTNRAEFKDDIAFARLSEQWPKAVKDARDRESRPCLTVNKVAPVIRQVVNDSRLNRPSITVRPVDSKADKETSEIMTGLIRNIEQSSDADIAYDTAIDNAVSGGFGYFRINLDYANDVDLSADYSTFGPEVFEKDIKFERIVNPLSVYADPDSTAATSEDWNVAFVIEDMQREVFEKKYPKASLTGFFGADGQKEAWISEKTVRVAEWWTRERTEKTIVLVAFPEEETQILDADDFAKRQQEIEAAGGRLSGAPRVIPSYKVTQRYITGSEVLETNEWLGSYIPIVPVYGDEVFCEGKRHLRSLIRDAKDANRMFNYWRTASTELVALAPKVPWLIEEGAIVDEGKWATANVVSHNYLEYRAGANRPERNALPSIPAGALQEAMNASDDVKATTGIYDASLGARSNETSGRAINARQREGDVSSFHFIDNLARSIRHAGRIVLDLIPKVYSTPRVIRILGEDGTHDSKQVNQEVIEKNEGGEDIARIFDLRVGRYDLAVASGPSFTTRREEAATQMIELIRAYPDAAPVLGDLLAKNLDWPGADEIAKRLEKMLPPQVRDDAGGVPPEIQAQLQQMGQTIQALGQQLQQAETDKSIDMQKLDIEQYKAETDRMQAVAPAMGPEQVQAVVIQTLNDLFSVNSLPQGEGPTGPTAFAEPDGMAV